MNFYSKELVKHGTASIKDKKFNYFFHDDKFDFYPADGFVDDSNWKKLVRKDFKNLEICCCPFDFEDVVIDIFGTRNPYLFSNNNFRCEYDKLFIHRNNCVIDVLEFTGPAINQIIHNTTFKRNISKGNNALENSLSTSFVCCGKKCELSVVTSLLNDEEKNEIRFISSIYFQFEEKITVEESFLVYKAFIHLIQFMAHRRDVYFSCNSYEIKENSLIQSGSLFYSFLSEKECDKESQTISLESILPVFGEMFNFVFEGKIIPLFIPVKKIVTLSDSYILSTAWAQMVFKQVYVTLNENYKIKNRRVYDYENGKKEICLQEQLSMMISDSFYSISDFAQISFPLLLGGIKVDDYISRILPERLKNVRNAIAHGSDNPKDYEYTTLDMYILLCSIYYCVLKKKCGLDDGHVRLALSELFFGSTEIFTQWKKLHTEE